MLETKKKFEELQLVELLEDLPEYDVAKGEIGTVVEVFDDPSEAYDLEFVGESGRSSKFAYSVRPTQIRSADEAAKEAFDRGVSLLNVGQFEEAERHFRDAISRDRRFLGLLNNMFMTQFGGDGNWDLLIAALRFVLCIDPSYAIASSNLAIAYLNYGVELATKAKVEEALSLFLRALTIPSSPEIVDDIRTNLAAAHTTLGIRAHKAGGLERATARMLEACASQPSDVTRSNLGRAYTYRAEAFMEEGRFDDAIAFFERAQETGFVPPAGLNNYGIALAQKSRFTEAIRAFERAARMLPNDEVIRANLHFAQVQQATALKVSPVEITFEEPMAFRPHQWQSAA